jgi:hypothetical protein
LQTEYEKKISYLNEENKVISNKLDEKLQISNYQKNSIREYELRNDITLKEIEEDKNLYFEREMLNKIKYDELERKYASLQKKIYEYQMNEDIRRAEINRSSNKALTSRAIKDEIETYFLTKY